MISLKSGLVFQVSSLLLVLRSINTKRKIMCVSSFCVSKVDCGLSFISVHDYEVMGK